MHRPYFERINETTFRATEQVGGAWDTKTQHIAPALGLLVHVVELDRDRRRTDRLPIGRLSYDIFGTVPIAQVELSVKVLRPGRTIELVEATLSHAGRTVVLLRAWLMQSGDTSRLQGTPIPSLPPPEELPAWDPRTVWPGGFIQSVEVRRHQIEPGRASFWVRTPVPLLEGEPVSPLASAAGLFDISNGMTVRADPREVAFPNVDLTAHLFREPRGEWLGFDTAVSFGPGGLGVTSSTIHDVNGPIGTVLQALTVRPG
jgi:hypothetical protein